MQQNPSISAHSPRSMIWHTVLVCMPCYSNMYRRHLSDWKTSRQPAAGRSTIDTIDCKRSHAYMHLARLSYSMAHTDDGSRLHHASRVGVAMSMSPFPLVVVVLLSVSVLCLVLCASFCSDPLKSDSLAIVSRTVAVIGVACTARHTARQRQRTAHHCASTHIVQSTTTATHTLRRCV